MSARGILPNCYALPSRDAPFRQCDIKPASTRGGEEKLAQFGRSRIPAPLWQALGQYARWLDPVIVREWRQLTANWYNTANRHSATKWGAAASDNAVADRDGATEGGPTTDDAFEWTESRYDTRGALERVKQLRDGGFTQTCVWSASRIRSSSHIECGKCRAYVADFLDADNRSSNASVTFRTVANPGLPSALSAL